MAKKWSNKNLPGALHFVTGNINNRRPIFKIEENCQVFLEELQNLKKENECKLIAFVVMPDHLHLIVNPKDGDIQQWTGALKSLSAKRLIKLAPEGFYLQPNGENQVWQESFKALPLWSEWMIWQKINYIHNNPLKGDLVKSAKDYRWTSFRYFYKLEFEEHLKVDEEWWFADDVRKLSLAMAEWDESLKEKYKK